LYGLTLFVSALLLFSIQPMFAKMVLPGCDRLERMRGRLVSGRLAPKGG
jgi:hypothetical protein